MNKGFKKDDKHFTPILLYTLQVKHWHYPSRSIVPRLSDHLMVAKRHTASNVGAQLAQEDTITGI